VNRLVLVAVVASALVIVWILLLIRNRRLQERHAILWLAAAIISAVLGAWQDGLGAFSRAIGVSYPPSALFLVVFVLFGLILLDTVIELSRTVARTRTLAQRIALLEERLRRVEGEAPEANNRA
jgi:Uncharacterized conserved protein (DUF2304)